MVQEQVVRHSPLKTAAHQASRSESSPTHRTKSEDDEDVQRHILSDEPSPQFHEEAHHDRSVLHTTAEVPQKRANTTGRPSRSSPSKARNDARSHPKPYPTPKSPPRTNNASATSRPENIEKQIVTAPRRKARGKRDNVEVVIRTAQRTPDISLLPPQKARPPERDARASRPIDAQQPNTIRNTDARLKNPVKREDSEGSSNDPAALQMRGASLVEVELPAMPQVPPVVQWLQGSSHTRISQEALYGVSNLFSEHGVASEDELRMLAELSELAQEEWLNEVVRTSGLTTLWKIMIKEALRKDQRDRHPP